MYFSGFFLFFGSGLLESDYSRIWDRSWKAWTGDAQALGPIGQFRLYILFYLSLHSMNMD